tara:strand:- start:181 stop:783 length:603 start_codon:yes stop_codon:yes gene_type:complete
MNMVVGITGGIGCGKSSVTDLLKKLDVDIVDADIIAREVVEPGKFALKKIVEYFGTEILLADGSLNRAQLRVIIFSEKEKKDWLEKLMHPLINDEIRAQIKSATTKYVVLSSALLLETRQKDLVDIVVVVDIPETLQIERTTLRDRNSSELVKKIIDSQLKRDERLSRADIVIDNSDSLDKLKLEIKKLHSDLKKKANDL